MPSRRNMIAMTDEETKEFIETGWTLQVASNGNNGFPHLVAMWYGVIDGKIHFTTYAKAPEGPQSPARPADHRDARVGNGILKDQGPRDRRRSRRNPERP